MKIHTRFGLCLLLVLAACQDEGVSPNIALPGNYSYTGLDLNGTAIATGTLTIQVTGDTISGISDLKGTGDECGSHLISGRLKSDTTFEIYFEPFDWQSVYLSGKLRFNQIVGDRISAQVYFSKLPQVLGTFYAQRLP